MFVRTSLANIAWLATGLFLGIVIDSTLFKSPARRAEEASFEPGHNMTVYPPLAPKEVVEPDPNRPVIVVDEPAFHFGRVESGGTVDHEFKIRNSGRSPLLITSVRPTCGCTLAEMSSGEILPGESASLKVQLNLHNLHGPQNKPIIVHSNAPIDGVLRLSLVGEVFSRVSIVPATVDFGQVKAGMIVSKTATVTALDDLQFTVTGLTTSGARVKASVESLSSTKQYSVSISLDSAGGSGHELGWVHLHTDHPGEYQSIRIPVTAQVTGAKSSSFKSVSQ